MTSNDYLVEMNFTPFATVPNPQEVAAFTERFVLPTLETCERLSATGRIVAGGTNLAAVGFTFIARTSTPAELEDMVASLPLWSRAQTRIVPLGTFENRAQAIRRRLQSLAKSAEPSVAGKSS